jgi:pteridine reductase
MQAFFGVMLSGGVPVPIYPPGDASRIGEYIERQIHVLRAANIRVNCIAPGVTAAGMAEASIASGKYDHFLTSGIVPRFGRAEDVARVVRFLLTPDCYVTGQVISVDGGASL